MTKALSILRIWLQTLIRNRMFHLVFVVTTVFVVAEVFLGDDAVRLGAESSRIAVFAALASVTFGAATSSFWNGARGGAEQMAISTFLLASAIFAHAVWVPLSRYEAVPLWMREMPITTAIIIAIALAGIGYIVPITRHREAYAPMVGSWTVVFLAGMLAGGIFASTLLIS